MDQYPKRKRNRIADYDYSQNGAYYITICTDKKEHLFWSSCRGELCSPGDFVLHIELSDIGRIVKNEIEKIGSVYDGVRVDQFCIMPDHIHLIISIDSAGRANAVRPYDMNEAPTISRIVKQFKGSVTKQLGTSIWQKSFYDHCIRNQKDYDDTWKYIEENPLKYKLGYRRG